MKKMIISMTLFIMLANVLTSCKKDNQTNQPTTNGTVLDSVIGRYAGTFEYGYWAGADSGTGDFIHSSNVVITKITTGKYKVQVSNIIHPYSFEIVNGRKTGNYLYFDIQNQLYISGPQTIRGKGTSGSWSDADFSYDLVNEVGAMAYGVDVVSGTNVIGYNNGVYNKN